MADMTIRYERRITINGRETIIRNPSTPTTLALTTLWDNDIVVPADSEVVAWDPTATDAPATPTAFKYLYLLADQEVDVELTVNEGDANEHYMGFRLPAGVPFELFDDAGYYNAGAPPASIFDATEDVIDRLRFRNFDASVQAIVRVVIGN